MPHIHTQPGQYDFTTSGFIFRVDGNEPKVILHWHKKLSVWMQFGGHVELHENPWQAVGHEIKEESGYDLNQLSILQPKIKRFSTQSESIIVHPYPLSVITAPFPKIDHFHTDVNFVFVTDQERKHQPGDGESTVLKSFTRQEIVGLPKSEIFDNIREMVLFVFDDCLDSWERQSL